MTTVAAARGDGIGPEIVTATVQILEAGIGSIEVGNLYTFDGAPGFPLTQDE